MPRAQACAQHCDCSCSPWGDTRQENLHTVPSQAVGDLVLLWHRTAWQGAAYAEPASLGCWQDVSKRKPNQAWVHSLEMVNMRVGGRMRCLTSLWSCNTSRLLGPTLHVRFGRPGSYQSSLHFLSKSCSSWYQASSSSHQRILGGGAHVVQSMPWVIWFLKSYKRLSHCWHFSLPFSYSQEVWCISIWLRKYIPHRLG